MTSSISDQMKNIQKKYTVRQMHHMDELDHQGTISIYNSFFFDSTVNLENTPAFVSHQLGVWEW